MMKNTYTESESIEQKYFSVLPFTFVLNPQEGGTSELQIRVGGGT